MVDYKCSPKVKTMPLDRAPLTLATAALLVPGVARAADLSLPTVFGNAAPLQKLVILGLVVATVASMVVSTRKLTSRHLTGGSAFVSGLRFGGPIAGVFGAAYSALKMSVGIATIPTAPTLKVLAPGFAEVATLVALGFCSGIVAVALHWAIQARIDREVLAA